MISLLSVELHVLAICVRLNLNDTVVRKFITFPMACPDVGLIHTPSIDSEYVARFAVYASCTPAICTVVLAAAAGIHIQRSINADQASLRITEEAV